MSANNELLMALLTPLMKKYKQPGGADQGDTSFVPPSQSAPAEDGKEYGAPASDASPDPSAVIPKAPRKPFSWYNEERISYPGKSVGTESGEAAVGRGMYGRFGQRYTNSQAGLSPPPDSNAQPQTGDDPSGTQNQRVWRGCCRPYGYRASSAGEPWPWQR
jgi:hypothetical protein